MKCRWIQGCMKYQHLHFNVSVYRLCMNYYLKRFWASATDAYKGNADSEQAESSMQNEMYVGL